VIEMAEEGRGDPVILLLVEDDPADARLIREEIKDSKLLNTMYHVVDGVEAMAFLRNQGKYADMPRPDLILLDLNMPRKDGRQTLKEIKEDPGLKRIPVVVLTVSDSEEDVVKSYDLHANSFVTKPLNLDRFSKVVAGIENFWFEIVKLPPKKESSKREK
jgi:chemotaxis family two-component system response regulator Rcp1